jgi:hypothetical protein
MGRAPPASLLTLLGLGASLARRGPTAVVSLVVAALTALGFLGVGLVLGLRGSDSAVHAVPLVASSALAWGGGFLLAFSASANALRRDRTTGIRHLFVTRTTSMRGYLAARVGGLAVLLAGITAGGTLLVGLGSILASPKSAVALRTAQATAAGAVHGVAFALVLAPLALAALGARTRFGGYLTLLAIVVLPELVLGVLGDAVPREVAELCSVPSALGALRAGLSPGSLDPFRCLRATVAILVIAAVGFAFVRRDVVLLEYQEEGTWT